MASKINITIDQGTTFSKTFEFVSNTLTLESANAVMRKHYTSTNVFSFSTTVSGSNVTIAMTANTTANIAPGRYMYDVRSVDTNNTVIRIVEGIATITPSMTR